MFVYLMGDTPEFETFSWLKQINLKKKTLPTLFQHPKLSNRRLDYFNNINLK